MCAQDKLDDQLTMVDGMQQGQTGQQEHTGALDDAPTMVVEPSPDTMAGQSPSERFEILEELGRGGMGVVYKARDKKLGRIIALKSLKPESTASNKAVERFWREAKAIAALSHFNIVGIYDVLEQGQALWIAMEFLPNGSLKDKVKSQGPLPPKEIAKIGRQLADAVDHAHSRGIFHRDIKPGNVLLSERDTPKLGDFGLAQEMSTAGDMTVAGAMMGTMYYAAPEQMANGSNVDARSDIYSLGATLYMIATGEAPRTIRPNRIPEEVRGIICKCLEEHPDKRFQNAAELAKAFSTGEFAEAPKKIGQACPACGHFNPETLRFCQKCGGGLASLFRKCPKCRAENHINVEYCGKCGENIPMAFLALKARKASADGQPQAAAKAWKAILAKDPKHQEARANLIRIVENNRKIKEMAKFAKEAYKRGDKESAYKCFCQIIEIDPTLEEAKKKCESMKPGLVQQRLARGRTFFSAKKYEQAYNQLQGVLDLDEFNREALDLMTQVTRFYKPAAPKVPKSAVHVSMGLTGSRKVNKKVMSFIAISVVVLFMTIIISLSRNEDGNSMFDAQAKNAAVQVDKALKAVVDTLPDQPVTLESILSTGVQWPPAVSVSVDDPDPEHPKVIVVHAAGKKMFIVNGTGEMKEEPFQIAPIQTPRPAVDE
ncbi:Serine/threonine protein kinase [Desulfatibacillum alkenivorans DSM 16219]|jgi:tRNA A-37 threonylcarbamoyl transferase component Bud32/tetratricopeptide (TPR) repeat protein|uniref:Serine/threonine protein kinase n=1 Tax=Desulfatibacillum alkenivorans DSM 16219 TaxID=1121393 RepID=A0A1M6TFU3_9BACT|nr:serine/threonine-protein kinase [Desulfatibacillum alkenivorans]SHK55850.1 Serine/threonine protein kinase [Desulfatibacillum alkenivorans DSM 16219]